MTSCYRSFDVDTFLIPIWQVCTVFSRLFFCKSRSRHLFEEYRGWEKKTMVLGRPLLFVPRRTCLAVVAEYADTCANRHLQQVQSHNRFFQHQHSWKQKQDSWLKISNFSISQNLVDSHFIKNLCFESSASLRKTFCFSKLGACSKRALKMCAQVQEFWFWI